MAVPEETGETLALEAGARPSRARPEPVEFGRYTLLGKLGSGGMADVFAAQLSAAGGFRKNIVIKRIRKSLLNEPVYVTLFLEEARVASRLSHANVCQVFELGDVDGEYYIAMEHLHGVSLRELLVAVRRAGDQLPIGLIVDVMAQVCAGLHHAHTLTDAEGNSVGVLHRDVSPHNIFVTRDGTVKLLDFGIAKAEDRVEQTRGSTLKGKDRYMSPEQLLGKRLDARTDIWAAGVVLHELISGRKLFQRETQYQTADAVLNAAIPSLLGSRGDVPHELEDVVSRCLCRDREWRYANADDLVGALRCTLPRLPSKASIGAYVERYCGDQLARNLALFAGQGADTDEQAPALIETLSTSTSSVVGRLPLRVEPTAVVPRRVATSVPTLDLDAESSLDESGVVLPPVEPAPAPAPKRGAARSVTLLLVLFVLGLAGGVYAWRTSIWTGSPPTHVAAAPPPDLAAASPEEVAAALPEEVAAALPEDVAAAPPEEIVAASPEEIAAAPQDDVAAAPPEVVARTRVHGPAIEAVAPDTEQAPADVKAAEDAEAKGDAEVLTTPRRDKPDRRRRAKRSRRRAAAPTGYGYLAIDSSPYATVFVAGKRVGVTPIAKFRLAAGKHRVRAVSSDGSSKRFTITVRADQTTRRRLTWR